MKKRLINIVLLITGALIIIIGLLFLYKNGLSLPCLFYEVTSLYCPGCGMTRSLVALLNGNFQIALQNNIMVIFTPILLIVIALITRRYIVHGKKIIITIPKYILYSLLVLIIAYGIIRNIPGFDWLAPIK